MVSRFSNTITHYSVALIAGPKRGFFMPVWTSASEFWTSAVQDRDKLYKKPACYRSIKPHDAAHRNQLEGVNRKEIIYFI